MQYEDHNSRLPEADYFAKPIHLAGAGLTALMILFPTLPLVTRLMDRALHLPPPIVLGTGLLKDALLASLLLTTLWLWWKGVVRCRWRLSWIALALYAGWLTVYLVRPPHSVLSVYAYRGDLEPLLVLVVAAFLPLSGEQRRKLLWGVFVVAVGVSLFGLYQVFVLRFPFLHRYFVDAQGVLSSSYLAFRYYSFPRAISTMTSPNQLGFYLAIVILAGLNLAIRTTGKQRWALLIVSVVCLVTLLFSLSRSAWVALAIGLLVSFVYAPNKRMWSVGAVGALLVIVPVAWQFHLTDRVVDTLTLRDPSAHGKIPSILQGVQFIQAHPMGAGLGTVGSRTERFGGTIQLHSESYYVQLGMEAGVIGLLLYLRSWGAAAGTLLAMLQGSAPPEDRAILVAALAALLGISAGAMFIPALQDIAVGSYLWLVVGLGIHTESSHA